MHGLFRIKKDSRLSSSQRKKVKRNLEIKEEPISLTN
jgi:hypothetical protein